MGGSSTVLRGESAVLIACAKLIDANIIVLKPISDCMKFDLALFAEDKFHKIQVKRAYPAQTKGKFQVSLRTVNLKPSGYTISTYSQSDVDFIVSVVIETSDVYCIPISLVAGRQGITLNPYNIVSKITNKKALNMEDYKNIITINKTIYKL